MTRGHTWAFLTSGERITGEEIPAGDSAFVVQFDGLGSRLGDFEVQAALAEATQHYVWDGFRVSSPVRLGAAAVVTVRIPE